MDKPIDPELEERLLRGLSEVRLGGDNNFTKPVTYVVTASKVYVVRNSAVAVVTRQIGKMDEAIPVVGKELEEGIALKVPRIPWKDIHKVLCYFRKVHNVHNAEAYASFWWDVEKKEYVISIPEQEITGASVRHKETFSRDGCIHVLDIHSHNTMGAFFSSGDDADEKYEHFCGVVGNIDTELPKWKFRLRVKDTYVSIPSALIIQPAEVAVKASVTLAMDTDGTPTVAVRVDLWSKVDELVPQEWMDQIKKTTFSSVGHVRSGGQIYMPWNQGCGVRSYGPYVDPEELAIMQETRVGKEPEPHEFILTPNAKKKSKKQKKQIKREEVETRAIEPVGSLYVFVGGVCYRRRLDGSLEEVDLSTGGNV